MKNNRNTLLFISGIIQIVKSFLYCIALLVLAVCFDVIYLWLKIQIVATDVYKYSSVAQGDKILTLIVIAIFIYLALSIVLNFVAGIVNMEASRSGRNPLEHRLLITMFATINILSTVAIVPSILTYIALVLDKSQPDGFKVEAKYDKETLKVKIEEIKELKKEKAITQEEYIELLNKLIVG